MIKVIVFQENSKSFLVCIECIIILWVREISICLINFFFLVSLRIIPAESNRSRVFSCRCWTAASKYTFNYPWLIRDTVLFFFFSLFRNDFHGDQNQSESVLARSHDVRN